MRRREFITFLSGTAIAWPLVARAQQPKTPAVGYVHSGSLDGERRQVDAFRRALNEAGYIEGQNVAIEYRWAEGHFDLVPARSFLTHRDRLPLNFCAPQHMQVCGLSEAGNRQRLSAEVSSHWDQRAPRNDRLSNRPLHPHCYTRQSHG
jgi:hypothetical protein